MKGKNFSCNNATGKRRKADFYQTPYSITEQLLENEKFDYTNSILEPASGKGAIVKVLLNKFKNVTHSDVNLEEKSDLGIRSWGCDFLIDYEGQRFDYIICNPPYSLAFEFIQKSKEVAKEKFAVLLPLSYLHGQRRFEDKVFRDCNYPLTKVHVFIRYPMLSDTIREDGKYTTGMMVYAWFIWENKFLWNRPDLFREYPLINWINNQKYILSKKDMK